MKFPGIKMTTPPTSELRPEEEMATPPTSELRPEEENKTRNQAEDKLRLEHIKKFLMKFTYNGNDGNWIQETRGFLLVVATVILGMSYQPILSPPDGLCQEIVAEGTVCGAGKSILAHTNRSSFNTYMSFNTMTFSASLAIIFILISGVPLKHRLAMYFLGMCICTALVTLALS